MHGIIERTAAARRFIAGAALLLGVVAAGSGCETVDRADRWVEKQWTVADHQLPKQSTDISVRAETTSATIAFAPRAAALSRHQRELLSRFVAGSGALRGDGASIATSRAGGRALAERRAQAIAAVLHRSGLRVARSFTSGDPDGVLVSITRLVAVPPNCPQWDDLMRRRFVDEYKPMFGCLDAASLATTVHRPEDLVQGRRQGPSDAQILDKGLQNLRDGKFDPPVTSTGTGSPQSGQPGGAPKQ
jgi:pilus biogenesis lipoprotein CpaD